MDKVERCSGQQRFRLLQTTWILHEKADVRESIFVGETVGRGNSGRTRVDAGDLEMRVGAGQVKRPAARATGHVQHRTNVIKLDRLCWYRAAQGLGEVVEQQQVSCHFSLIKLLLSRVCN